MTKNEFKARLLLQNLRSHDITELVDIDIKSKDMIAHSYSSGGQFVIEEILCAVNFIAEDERIRDFLDYN